MKHEDKIKGTWKILLFTELASLIVAIPYGWMVIKAFTTADGAFTLSNWSFLYQESPFFRGLVLPVIWPSIITSLIFAAVTALLQIVVTIPTAYTISRMQFCGRTKLTKLMIILDAFPTVALLIGFFYVLNALGLINTYIGVVLVKVGMSLSGSIWLMKGFFDQVPWDIEWATTVDGASRFTAFLKVIIPAVKPGSAVILVYSFLSGWAEYMLINLFIYSSGSTVSTFIGLMLDAEGKTTVPYGIMAAASLLYVLPTVLLFIFSQKMLLKVSQGGSKQL